MCEWAQLAAVGDGRHAATVCLAGHLAACYPLLSAPPRSCLASFLLPPFLLPAISHHGCHRHGHVTGEEHGSWTYDVDKVGGSFALFYGYVGLVGLALWGVLKWFKAGLSLASIWCIYGAHTVHRTWHGVWHRLWLPGSLCRQCAVQCRAAAKLVCGGSLGAAGNVVRGRAAAAAGSHQQLKAHVVVH